MIIIHSSKDGFNLQAFDVLAVGMFFVSGTYGIKGIANFLGMGTMEENFSFLIYMLWAIVYLKFLWNNKQMIKYLLIFELIYTAILYINYMQFPATQEFYEEYQMFLRQVFIVYIPSMSVAVCIKDFSGCIQVFRQYGIMGILFMIACYFMGYLERWDYQYYGIHLCPFVLMVVASYIHSKNKIDLLWILLGFLFLMAGGRQSFIGLLVGFVVLYFSQKLNNVSVATFLSLVLFSISFLVSFVVFSPLLVSFLGDILKAVGIESRTFDMLNASELTSIDTRDDIYALSMYFIERNMYDVNGLFADRVMLREVNSWMAYPHNIILELLMDFGIIFGGLISLAILLLFGIRLYSDNIEKKLLVGVIGSAVLVRLMVSSSFMIEGPFYLMLGLFLNSKDERSLIRKM